MNGMKRKMEVWIAGKERVEREGFCLFRKRRREERFCFVFLCVGFGWKMWEVRLETWASVDVICCVKCELESGEEVLDREETTSVGHGFQNKSIYLWGY